VTSSAIAVVLLAAGRGTRFGGGKLGADLAGRPVVHHVANRLATLPLARKLAICASATPEIPGFERVQLEPPDAPLSHSIATAIAAIVGAEAALIALGDMPLVPTRHFAALISAFDGDRVGTCVAGRTMAPAILGARHFPAMLTLSGDQGAAALLRGAPAVLLDECAALDIDTPEDLQRAATLLQGR
jgi:molybdenum cofactor cytidylyltransferase